MLDEAYRKEMDQMGPNSEQMDRLMAAMEAKGRRPRPLRRTVVLAAAVCAALVMTAVAASPGVMDALNEFLGGFTPYNQPVDAAACVANGIEIRVISAMADSAVVKVYAEARDVSGQDRLSDGMDVWGMIDRSQAEDKAVNEGNSTTGGGRCVSYDPETGVALLEFSTWGSYTKEPEADIREGMELIVLGVYPDGFGRGEVGEDNWRIPLDIQVLPSREVALSGTVGTVRLSALYLSPLGPTILYEQEKESVLQYAPLAVYLADGTVLLPRWEGGGGFGLKPDGWTIDPRGLECWAFDSPVDPEQVVGISLAYWYIPIDGAAAGEGHWLTELPG